MKAAGLKRLTGVFFKGYSLYKVSNVEFNSIEISSDRFQRTCLLSHSHSVMSGPIALCYA